MPKRKIDPPAIQEWVASLSLPQRQQYAPAVRAFFERRGEWEPASVTTEELVAFALASESDSMRTKRVCALRHFFARAAEAGATGADPARFLGKAVQQALFERSLVDDLRKAGIREAQDLSWRDVMSLTLGNGGERTATRLDDALRRLLAVNVVQRIQQSTNYDEIVALLDAPLLEYAIPESPHVA